MRILILPLLVLEAFAAYVAGLGFAASWHPVFPLEYTIAGALHAAWTLPAARRSGSFLLIAACWIVSLWLASAGSSFETAILLEGICLLLALSIAPVESWPQHLAHWRRTRTEILIQLRMGQGVVPWFRTCLRQLAVGAADTPLGSDYQRFAAALADAEHRLRVRLNRAAVPEQLRQSILGNVSAIVARAETAAAQRAIEMEQQALAAAAACREQCERMEGLPAPERKALASQCEQIFLELARY